MKLEYVFQGIETSHGKYPRAIVTVGPDRESQDEIPAHLCMPSMRLTLPLSSKSLEQSLAATSAQAIEAARTLVNESALADWLRTQS